VSAADVEFLRSMFEDLASTEASGTIDLETVEPWWHPEIEYVEDPKWPGSNSYRGREEVLRVWNGYLEVFSSARLDVEKVVDAGDETVAVIRISGVSEGAEVPFDQVWGYVCRLRDGKLGYYRAYTDPEEALADAGVSSSS
jgi:ketosteroid isomerase-like protein